MELKWEILIFRDFTSHTLCKYAHHPVSHWSWPKTSWRGRCLECTVWLSPPPPRYPARLASACIHWHSWILREEGSHSHLISYQIRSSLPFQHLPNPFSMPTMLVPSSNIPGNTAMLIPTLPTPSPTLALCSNSHSIPPGWKSPFLSIIFNRLFHSDYRLKFE